MDTHKVPASYPGDSFSTRVIGSKASWEGSESSRRGEWAEEK